jgi:predicted permease
VVRGVLLKPLPFHEPERLAMLNEARPHEDSSEGHSEVSGGMYAEWKKQNRSYASLALARGIRIGLSGSGGQLPEKLYSALISWDLLGTLGVEPALGRDFAETDDRPAANGTVLLSWGLWKRRFGGDPAILNRTIYIDARPFTVIGIMPAWFDFPDPSTQLWAPIYHDVPENTMNSYSEHRFGVVGRLKPGVSTAQGAADLSVISQRIRNAHLNDPFVFGRVNSRALLEDMVGDIKKPLYVLLEATCCLLLIACLNVANLLVARAAARRKELAIRAALGGGWMRLVQERLLESLLLSAAGGALGLLLAGAALEWLTRIRPEMSRIESINNLNEIPGFRRFYVADRDRNHAQRGLSAAAAHRLREFVAGRQSELVELVARLLRHDRCECRIRWVGPGHGLGVVAKERAVVSEGNEQLLALVVQGSVGPIGVPVHLVRQEGGILSNL